MIYPAPKRRPPHEREEDSYWWPECRECGQVTSPDDLDESGVCSDCRERMADDEDE